MNRISQTNIFTILLLSFAFITTISAQPSKSESARLFRPTEKLPDFAKIDDYVLGLRAKTKTDAELAALITKQSKTKTEKARAIFIWIANNIAYDTDFKITTKEGALKQRKGVCQAYSDLFKYLGDLAGLEAHVVSGDAKDFFYKSPEDLDPNGHAWNVFKTDDGRWAFVDATWGAGYVNDGVFTRELATYWFDPSPEIYIFSHFPAEEKWQLLDKPVSRDWFLKTPPLSPKLVGWGLHPAETFAFFNKTSNDWFPFVYSVDLAWTINAMPASGNLKIGGAYDFEFVLPNNDDVAIIVNNTDWVRFTRDGEKFSATFAPESAGQAIVAVRQPTGKYAAVFQYDVK